MGKKGRKSGGLQLHLGLITSSSSSSSLSQAPPPSSRLPSSTTNKAVLKSQRMRQKRRRYKLRKRLEKAGVRAMDVVENDKEIRRGDLKSRDVMLQAGRGAFFRWRSMVARAVHNREARAAKGREATLKKMEELFKSCSLDDEL